MKTLVSAIAFTFVTFLLLPALSTKAILPDSVDYKQAQSSAKSNLQTCLNNKGTRINGKCILFYAVSTENSEVYKLVNGKWQAATLQMFDSQIADGKISSIAVIKFDKEWAYDFTNNKTPGRKLFRLRMSTINYNYGC
jgi:hypothetical protein